MTALERREESPAEALEVVERYPDQFPVENPELVAWLVGQRSQSFNDSVRSIYLRALQQDREVSRLVLHPLGASAWYAGDIEQAEQYWRRGMAEGEKIRDDFWCRSVNNMALVKAFRGAVFESLVLCGVVLRTVGDSYSRVRVFATTQKARALIRLEHYSDAQFLIEQSLDLAAKIPDESERAAATQLSYSVLMDSHAHFKRWQDVILEASRILQDPFVPDPVRAGVEIDRLIARFEVEDGNRVEILDEMLTVQERFELSGRWAETCRLGQHMLRWRDALLRGVVADCEQEAHQVLGALNSEFSSMHFRRAFEYLEQVPLDPQLHQDFEELFVTSVLHRLDLSLDERDTVAGLDSATPEDWQILADYQRRLLGPPQTQLRRGIARRWKPGLPAYDRLVSEDFVKMCAWCTRLQANHGDWIVNEELSRVVSNRFTHGICPDCASSLAS